MDGVIVQTHETSASVMKTVVHDFLKVDPSDADIQHFYGVSDQEFYAALIEEYNSKVVLDDMLTAQFSRYNNKLRTEVKATEYIVEVIRQLSQQYIVAICSGSTRKQVDIVLNRFNLTDCIAMSISCNDVMRGKPNPEGYNKILTALAVDSSHALAVEDSSTGIQAALSAGIIVVGFDNKLNQDISLSDYQCDDIRQVVTFAALE